MKVRLTRRATGDVESIAEYIQERNPSAALRVRDAIEAVLKLLTKHPQVGHHRKNGIRRFVLPRFPYLIFYRIDENADEIVILTVRHAARREDM